MSGKWKRSMVKLVRHWQTKEPAIDRLHLNHRATSRLYPQRMKASSPPRFPVLQLEIHLAEQSQENILISAPSHLPSATLGHCQIRYSAYGYRRENLHQGMSFHDSVTTSAITNAEAEETKSSSMKFLHLVNVRVPRMPHAS